MTVFFYQLRRLFYLSLFQILTLSQQIGIDHKPCREQKVISAGYTACIFHVYTSVTLCGQGSSVGIATDYGLNGPGSNSGGDEIFRTSRPGPGAHPAPCTMGAGSFPGLKCGRGVLLTTHPLLVPRSWKSRAIPLPTLWGIPGL